MRLQNTIQISFLGLMLLAGCTSAADKERLAQQKADIERKKGSYAALQKQIEDKTFVKGTPAAEIEEKFGKPDSIFHSGSGESTFDIWTYEQIITSPNDDGRPVRLYFNNRRLVSWGY